VEVSSSEDEPAVDVEAIADQVLDAEFEDDRERAQFLGERAEPTNLSERADDWWMAQSDD
jgi:DNA-directed RNA polymerase subunit A'